uniref:Uncharacterized protein n=1 Tax=Globodera rostochiensis TaxID=31243 RepID=A0A914HKZ1_GLORO
MEPHILRTLAPTATSRVAFLASVFRGVVRWSEAYKWRLEDAHEPPAPRRDRGVGILCMSSRQKQDLLCALHLQLLFPDHRTQYDIEEAKDEV